MFIVGIDVGGTFTDLTAADETTGKVVVTKVPSTPRNESAAVLSGLQALGIAGRDVRRLVHGTTVGTNAVLERRGARVAILTTAGFRDLIEIGRTKRNIPALFVPTFVRPKPVVERKHRFEVLERLAADGTVLAPLEPASVERALDAAVAAGAEALAVCLLHAYLNPAHERAVADAAKGRYPKLPVSCSADVVAEYREFERFSTTVLNAYLQPIMDSYLAGLEERLRATGYAHGVLTVASSGGMMTTETARRLPIKTIFSGPAGGVSQACFVGEVAGVRDFITYDMGGTSTDVCLVRDLAPLTTSDGMLGAFPVKVPQLDMHSVGAGGGSIAGLDIDGSLKVGPGSAGAAPMHALALAQEIGIPRVLVPRHPGNFSALGLLASQIKHDDVRTRVGPLRERLGVALELFGEMEDAARHQLGLEGFTPQEQRLVRSLDLRYQGQAFELNVALGEPSANGLALDILEAEFHRQHLAAYGHSSPGAQIELVNARLTAYGVVPRPAGERYRSASESMDMALAERRAVWFQGAPHDCPVWERERLPEGATLRGPAIVEEFGATTIVPPGWRGEVDVHGNLRCTRETPA